jgi:hypothetical protein
MPFGSTMQRRLEIVDISTVAAYGRRLGRAAVSGVIAGSLVLFGLAVPALRNANWGEGLLWFGAGIAAVCLSFFLQRGSRVATMILTPALVVGLILVWKWLLLRWQRMPAGAGAATILLAMLVVGPIAYFLISGIETVYKFGQSGSTAFFESHGFDLFSALHQEGREKQERSNGGMSSFARLQGISEALALTGAGMMLVNALLALRSIGRIEWLSMAGLVLLILGVNLSLRVERTARKKTREWLMRERRPPILLLQSADDETLKVRARFTLSRSLVSSFPRLRLTRVIEEQLSRIGPVITIGEAEHLEAIWAKKLEGWMADAQAVVVIPGRVESLHRKFGSTVERVLREKGIVVFPPLDFWQLKSRWESFCLRFSGLTSEIPISGIERSRAVLLVFRDEEKPLLIVADSRDEWTYQAAFEIVTGASSHN